MKNPHKRLAGRETSGRLRKQKCFNPARCKCDLPCGRGCCFIAQAPTTRRHSVPQGLNEAGLVSVLPRSRQGKLSSFRCLDTSLTMPRVEPLGVPKICHRWLVLQCVCARQLLLFSLITRYHCSTWNTSNTCMYIIACDTCMARNLLAVVFASRKVWKRVSVQARIETVLDFKPGTPPPLFPRIPSPRGALQR